MLSGMPQPILHPNPSYTLSAPSYKRDNNMLTKTTRANFLEDVDSIQNYYERLVLQEVALQSNRVQAGDSDFLADVACVALNRLPPRYIRHNVDMSFFMSPQELHEIEEKIKNAVSIALNYVESRERGEDVHLPPHNATITEPAKKG